MSSARPVPDDVLALFDKAIAGSLETSEQARLEELLRDSADLRREYRNYMAVHIDLAGAVRMARARENLYREIQTLAIAESAATPSTWSRFRNSRLGGLGLASVVAIAASLLLALVLRESPPDPAQPSLATKPPAPVATLATVDAAVWRGTPLTKGQSLYEGESFELVSGTARISVGVGAEMIAAGPCRLTMQARDRIKLDEGEVTVNVAEWAKGFTIVTSAMEVVDLGTTFSVSATADASATTRVLSGQVRVSPSKVMGDGPRSVLLNKGEAMEVSSTGERLTVPAGEVPDNIDWGALRPYRPVVLHNTGLGFATGDEDPHWRVIAGPEEHFKGDQFAMVCVPDERYLPNDTNVSQWVSLADWRNSKTLSTYTFQTTFDLNGYDLATIQLFGRFLADNGIDEVRINGRAVEVKSWTDNTFGQRFDQPQFRTINVTEGLRPGRNVVEIDVWNGTFSDGLGRAIPDLPNPMALRVEWYAFGRQGQQQASRNFGRR